MKRVLFCLMVLTLLVAAQANANVVRNAGTTEFIIGVTGFSTSGDEMVGMLVTANFAGSSETVAWQATGVGSGAAIGTGWSLALSGDTFTSSWLLTNSSTDRLISLLVDPFPGDTVFDTLDNILFPAQDTPNSANGLAQFDDPLTGTYTNLVGITGDLNSPYGDLYRYLEVTFQSGALSGGETASWRADTDSIGLVPIPGSLLLLGSGLMGLVGFRFRRG